MGIFTRGKVWIAADRRSWVEYDTGDHKIHFYVDGVEACVVSDAGLGGAADSNGAVGAATVVAAEYGDSIHHTTVLTATAFNGGTSGDAAAKAVGSLLYTFPAGIVVVESAQLVAFATTAAMTPTTDTPEIGLGTTQASGVTATLGAVASTAEDIFEGTAIADVGGTAFSGSKYPTAAVPLVIPAASVHTVYLNYAATWADVDAAAPLLGTGVVVLNWRKLT